MCHTCIYHRNVACINLDAVAIADAAQQAIEELRREWPDNGGRLYVAVRFYTPFGVKHRVIDYSSGGPWAVYELIDAIEHMSFDMFIYDER